MIDMKKIILIFLALFCLIQFSSCENFLGQHPSHQAESSTAIASESDATVMMNGIMRQMLSSSYYGRNMMLYADAKGGDMAVVALGRGSDGYYTFSHAASSGTTGSGYWAQIYYCILQVNSLLAGIDHLEATSGALTDKLKLHKGQALTLRALMHFDLVRLYGKPYTTSGATSTYGVPIATEVLPTNAMPGRNTVGEVYSQLILPDLAAAKDLLNNSTGKSKQNGFLNYYGNRAIYARVTLNMGNYDEAFSAAEEVITGGVYSLYSNANWVSSWSNQFGSESIFELIVLPTENDLTTTSWGAYLLRVGDTNASSSILGYFVASQAYVDRLNEGNSNDVRLGLMYADEKGNNRSCKKYSGVDYKGDKGSYSAVNIKVIRLSEMYLIAAEAALLKSSPEKDKAATYLQNIRKRSPDLAPATAATVTLDMILDERSRELFMEGHRFFDMMRHGKSITYDDGYLNGAIDPVNGRPQTIDGSFYKTILPIWQSEINANPTMKDQQNPGY